MFRFSIGDRVHVVTHPRRPPGTVAGRWSGESLADAYDENVYEVSGFVTRQRESSLAGEGFTPIPLEPLTDWRIAGAGGFRRAGPGIIESEGGPGILWYARDEVDDFVLMLDWRVFSPDDRSSVFLRIPPLAPEDWTPAVEGGYEIRIDLEALGPRAGAVEALARPAPALAWRRWNTFAIVARGDSISVSLNGRAVGALAGDRRRHGHIGLQCHHAGSRVQFRNLQIRRLAHETPSAAAGARLAA
jgi:hypothetical protein